MAARFAYVYSMADDAARVQKVAPRHAAYWHALDLAGYSGGPFADRSGGLVTFLADGLDEAEHLVAGDPFMREGLLESHSLEAWQPTGRLSADSEPTKGTGEHHPDVTPFASPAQVDGMLPVPLQLQLIGMEQWALLSTRSLTWSESFSRGSMFLTTLSGAIVGLALAAQATAFGRGFLWFALVVLAIVLFVGVATFARLVAVNSEDVLWVQGLNRLRHACLELAPGLEGYFVAGSHDDEAGVLTTLGAGDKVRGIYHHVFVTTPAIVGVLIAMLAASLAATTSLLAGLGTDWSIGVALATFVSIVVLLTAYQLRSFYAGRPFHSVRFPTTGHPVSQREVRPPSP